jgi:hypothetical protein
MVTVPPVNLILASLPADLYVRIAPQLELRRLVLAYELSQPNEIMDVVYFPLSGVVSLVAQTSSGESIEAMLLGKEGVVGFWRSTCQHHPG